LKFDIPARTEQRDELAPFHSITSSARASKVGGISRPPIAWKCWLTTGR